MKSAQSGEIDVFVRVRPPLPREQKHKCFEGEPALRVEGNVLEVFDGSAEATVARRTFAFDGVFGPSARQSDVFERLGAPAVGLVAAGQSAAILAYGQTGSGKTFSVEGGQGELAGLAPRAVARLFALSRAPISLQCLEIYNETVSDLLSAESAALALREERGRGFYVENLSDWPVQCVEDALDLLRRAAERRTTAGTRANDKSSRSHAIFRLKVGGGCLALVDLAGSERLRVSGAGGQRLEECKHINQSLGALAKVVSALGDASLPFVPFRDSKLTMLLAEPLNSRNTALLATLAPSAEHFSETLSTLKFARRVKKIAVPPRAAPSDGGRRREAVESELRAALASERATVEALTRRLEESAQSEECRALLGEQRRLLAQFASQAEQREQQIRDLQRRTAALVAAQSRVEAFARAKAARVEVLEAFVAQLQSRESRASLGSVRRPSDARELRFGKLRI